MSYVLSPRSLNLYSECPRCFYEEINEKKPRPKGPFPSLPSGMDAVLKTHFDSYMGRGLPPELASLEGEVRLFNDVNLLKKWREREGLSWKSPNGNVLKGSIDNILEAKNGNLIVLDYKTRGYPVKEDTAGHYELQMNLYNLLLVRNGWNTEDYSMLLFYYPKQVHPKTGLVEFNKEIVKISVDRDSAERTFEDALYVLLGKKPDAAKGCGFCSWAKGKK